MVEKFPKIEFLEHFLMPLLGKTTKMLSLFMKDRFAEHGFDLTREQFILLAHLYHFDGLMQKELAFITERNKGSLARLINTMEKKNFVARIPSTADKRVNRVYLTKYGRNVFKKLKPVLVDCDEYIKEGLTKEEIELTIAVLRKIQNNILKS